MGEIHKNAFEETVQISITVDEAKAVTTEELSPITDERINAALANLETLIQNTYDEKSNSTDWYGNPYDNDLSEEERAYRDEDDYLTMYK